MRQIIKNKHVILLYALGLICIVVAHVYANGFDNIINQVARENNVDPALVRAVISAESGFAPRARSAKGACGLMQLMPDTAAGLGVKDIYSPHENVTAGVRYLREMLVRYKGDVEKALAAYNAGPTAVDRYKKVPPYKETQRYIKKVHAKYRKYATKERICAYTDSNGCMTFYNIK